uniref:Reverse transcriptase Ty1/copia-type domain-containing protein n=1 Tax=Solanum lycopersicum TaxID=4081 RepID=A0A3Q7GKK2_SOLLC
MAVSSSTNGADTPFADITHFRSLIGALQYLAITRPDIQFAVNRVAQRMHQPSEHDYHCLKRILMYIFGTLGRGLLIRPGDLELRGFLDSDWANDKNDRKSTSGLKDDSFIYLVLYVDDMLIVAKKKYDIQKLKGLLSAEFEMKDLGAARKILGMEIIRDRERRKLFLSQRSYIQKVLARFGMSSSKPIYTPSAANIHLTAMFAPQLEEEKEYMSRVPYASVAGSLMYAMVCTTPDLAHTVSVVSRFMGQPGREHWQAVKRIFRYLRGTSYVGLIYGGDTQCLVTGYSDSDYAGDVDTRRSMTRYVFTLGGSVVVWKATLQPTVTLSTMEAEYMALTEAAKEGIWLKGLNPQNHLPKISPTTSSFSIMRLVLQPSPIGSSIPI